MSTINIITPLYQVLLQNPLPICELPNFFLPLTQQIEKCFYSYVHVTKFEITQQEKNYAKFILKNNNFARKKLNMKHFYNVSDHYE
jgi:hypothetical protein